MTSSATTLSMATALAAMKHIEQGSVTGEIDAFGVTKEDMKLTTGDTVWKGSDRSRVTNVLEVIMFGTVDVMGVPRFDIPAEYVAAVIAVFVAPSNTMLACRYLEGRSSAASIVLQGSDESAHGLERCTARQLFSLVLQIKDDSLANLARVSFEKRTKLAIEHAKMKGGE